MQITNFVTKITIFPHGNISKKKSIPLFTITFRSKIVILGTDSILRLKSEAIYCVKVHIYSDKATKFCEIFTLLFFFLLRVKSKVKILWPSQNIWTLIYGICFFPFIYEKVHATQLLPIAQHVIVKLLPAISTRRFLFIST